MSLRSTRLAAALLLALWLPAASAGAEAPAKAEASVDKAKTDTLRAKETFAVVWQRLRESPFDDETATVDWDALKARHQPRIEQAGDLLALRREIQALFTAIGVSHLSLVPAEALAELEDEEDDADSDDSDDGDAAAGDKPKAVTSSQTNPAAATPGNAGDKRTSGERAPKRSRDAAIGLRLALIDDAGQPALVVVEVEPGSAAQAAGLRPGWRVAAIDGRALAPVIRSLDALSDEASRPRAALEFQLRLNLRFDRLKPGDDVRFAGRDARGRRFDISVRARRKQGQVVQPMPGIPPDTLRYRAETVALASGGCALNVRFDVWALEVYPQFAASLQQHTACESLLLDLRGNPGGQIAAMTAVAGLLFDQRSTLGKMKTADNTMNLTILPRQVADDGSDLRRLRGPVAILIDRGSASSSEIFAGALQAVGRARLFGETSAGMALPAMTSKLPSGDWLYYPTADFTDPKGRRVEGLGVQPDDAQALQPQTLAEGRDAAREAALAWLARQPQSPTP
jgi:hypothetical protein